MDTYNMFEIVQVAEKGKKKRGFIISLFVKMIFPFLILYVD